jgi:hypothetical protein
MFALLVNFPHLAQTPIGGNFCSIIFSLSGPLN